MIPKSISLKSHTYEHAETINIPSGTILPSSNPKKFPPGFDIQIIYFNFVICSYIWTFV